MNLKRKLTSLAAAVAMTVCLFAAVVLTGHNTVGAENVPTAPAQTSDATLAAPTLYAAAADQLTVDATPGVVVGALQSPDGTKTAPDKADGNENAAAVSDTSVLYVGTVNSSGVYIRREPVSGDVLDTLDAGTAVSILGQTDGWYQVSYDGKIGYMSAEFVTARAQADDLNGYAWLDTDVEYLLALPERDSTAIGMVCQGEYVTLNGFANGWYDVTYCGYDGYMPGDCLAPVASLPASEESADAPDDEPASYSEPDSGSDDDYVDDYDDGYDASPSEYGGSVADYAAQFLGVPYVYGGASPYGFDCSGFTMYVYQQFGYSLPHGASGQLRCGTAVSRSELQPGDLVMFYDSDYDDGGASATHVGIYVGGGQFIHASSYRAGVCYSSLSESYYSSCFCGARRIG